jgi:hypothetical protein
MTVTQTPVQVGPWSERNSSRARGHCSLSLPTVTVTMCVCALRVCHRLNFFHECVYWGPCLVIMTETQVAPGSGTRRGERKSWMNESLLELLA